MSIRLAVAALALASTPLAAQSAPDGKELHGRTVLVEYADGQRIETAFKADGTFSGKSGDQAMAGTYRVQPGQLCFTYDGGGECWPYATAFVPGQTVDTVAPDGRRAKVTLGR